MALDSRDPQCPATLLLARHAKAEYVEDRFSDEGGSLTASGRVAARGLGADLVDRRIAWVYTSDVSRAVQTGEIAASVLDCGVTACTSLREVFIGDLLGGPFDVRRIEEVADRWHDGDLDARFPGGESGADVVGRHRDEFEHIADRHRGETVLVVGHQTALRLVVPVLTGRQPWATDRLRPAPCEYVALERDAGGWELRTSDASAHPAR